MEGFSSPQQNPALSWDTASVSVLGNTVNPFDNFVNGIEDPFRDDGFPNLPPVMSSTNEELFNGSIIHRNGPSCDGGLQYLTPRVGGLEGGHPRPWQEPPEQSSPRFSIQQLASSYTTRSEGLNHDLEHSSPLQACTKQPLAVPSHEINNRTAIEGVNGYSNGRPVDHERNSTRYFRATAPYTPYRRTLSTATLGRHSVSGPFANNLVAGTVVDAASYTSPSATNMTSSGIIDSTGTTVPQMHKFLVASHSTYPYSIEGNDFLDFPELPVSDPSAIAFTRATADPSIPSKIPPMFATTPLMASPTPPAAAAKQTVDRKNKGGSTWVDKEIRHVQRLRAAYLDSEGVPHWSRIYQEYQKTYGHLGRTKQSLRKKLGEVDKAAQQAGTSSRTHRKWGMVVPSDESDAEGENQNGGDEEGEEDWDGLWEE